MSGLGGMRTSLFYFSRARQAPLSRSSQSNNLPLPRLLDGTHIRVYRLIIDLDALEGWCRAVRMQKLLEASRSVDEDRLDLIEAAFLEGQVTGLSADLAYYYLVQISRFSTVDCRVSRPR
jgi:hypothetical protein